MSNYIVVGADPSAPRNHHGGVLTLCAGLFDYASEHGYKIKTINTLRTDTSKLSFLKAFLLGVNRVLLLLLSLLDGTHYKGVIIFAGAKFSFYERVGMALLCRVTRVPCMMIIVDGTFLNVLHGNPIFKSIVSILLKVPNKQLASGQRWVDLFKQMNLSESKIVHTLYWLPSSFKLAQKPKPSPLLRPLKFVFVGWMIKEKGVEEILEAIDILKLRYQFQFVFIGGGTLLDMVKNHIEIKNWSRDVSALGWVESSDFQILLESQDVFVLPSYSEGFPMSLIEAFSKALPAIVSDVGGVSDSLVHGVNGYLVQARSSSSLASAMENYLQNPSLVIEHSRAALETAESNHNANTNCGIIFNALLGR